ncbi:MAG: SusC/RagA family TonB-linked outer membrane protein [Bacteroidales bacterium]
MRKQLLFLLVLFISAVSVFAQQKVTGLVLSSEDGLPVIGASVIVKGTTVGSITDIDGKFVIEVPDKDATLVISYVGMEDKEVKVGGQTHLKIALAPKVEALEEVVVVAMGVKAEKKKLNYAVQTLSSDEVTAGQSSNFVTSLQGKIAGVQISGNGGSPNGGTNIQIRALSSMSPSQNNGPLFVIDGMAVNGSGSNMENINPNDIENMSVLKGAAASALYGSQGANGVVLITTKSGKAGKIQVNANASVQIDNCVNVPEIQSMYAPGVQGFYKPLQSGGWGPLIQPGQKTYNNVNDFFQTGLFQKYDVSVSGGTEKMSAYASFNFMDNQGVVPNDYKKQYGGLLKASFDVSEWVRVNAQMNFTKTQSRGFENSTNSSGALEYSMNTIYNWPITNNMSNYITEAGEMIWRDSWDGLSDQEKLDIPVNPYWRRYQDWGKNKSTRNILMASVIWSPIDNLDLTGKISYDQNNYSTDGYITPRFKRSDFSSEDFANARTKEYGSYNYDQSESSLLTLQAIANYRLKIAQDYELGILVGGEMQEKNGLAAELGGYEFLIPGGFYSISNINGDRVNGSNLSLLHNKKRMAGIFGEIKFDYKGLAHISATGRNDYSSTLSKKSYFYPSVTAGVIFSELLEINSSVFSYGKVRGNWARVGKDASPYLFDRKFYQRPTFPDQGFSVNPTLSVATHLDPEMIDSWEIGTDLRFFNNKTSLDIAYYSTQVDNQIVSVRVSPAVGNILETRNEGSIKNHGVEIQLNQKILSTPDFTWDAAANFTLNRSKVVKLPDGIVELQGTQYGDAFPTAYLNGSTTAISGKDYLRTPDGKIICSEEGFPQINPAKSVLIGDRQPDFLLGISSNFRWKDLTVGFLFDGRKGGDVLNVTGRSLLSNGQSKLLETYRNRWVVFDGVVLQPDGSYQNNTKPILLNQTNLSTYVSGATSNFVEDGSYIRLSYVTVAYDLSRFVKKCAFTGLKLSVTGRNLFLLTKYSGNDPQINANPSAQGTGAFGIDNFSVPNTRSFNFTLTANF